MRINDRSLVWVRMYLLCLVSMVGRVHPVRFHVETAAFHDYDPGILALKWLFTWPNSEEKLLPKPVLASFFGLREDQKINEEFRRTRGFHTSSPTKTYGRGRTWFLGWAASLLPLISPPIQFLRLYACRLPEHACGRHMQVVDTKRACSNY